MMPKYAGWLLAGAALFGPKLEAAAAEVYPPRPIRMIVPSGAGGITDILARVIAVTHIKTGRIRALGVGASQRERMGTRMPEAGIEW